MKKFSINLSSPEDSNLILFSGEDDKTEEDFMNSMLEFVLDRKFGKRCFSFNEIFPYVDCPDIYNDSIKKLKKTMGKNGFELIINKPDVEITDCSWAKIMKKNGKYYVDPFYDIEKFSEFLIKKGFEETKFTGKDYFSNCK